MTAGRSTLLLTRSDVAELLTMGECIDAVESAFLAHARGEAGGPSVASVHVDGGGFHVKAASLTLGRPYFAAKTNGNFSENDKLQLPRIQGSVVLCDATNGTPLAILDSIEITILRTAAATAVAAKHLARGTSRALAIIGCGVQGHASLRAIRECFPIEELFLYDSRPGAAQSLAAVSGLTTFTCASVDEALAHADICVTATPCTLPIVLLRHLHPGLFIAAVGADSEAKNEIAPEVMRSARVIVDSREQAVTIGDTRHAIDPSHPASAIIAASLGEVIAGTAVGRRFDDEVVIFDSTGTALQDVAAAAIVFEKALRLGRGRAIDLAS